MILQVTYIPCDISKDDPCAFELSSMNLNLKITVSSDSWTLNTESISGFGLCTRESYWKANWRRKDEADASGKDKTPRDSEKLVSIPVMPAF